MVIRHLRALQAAEASTQPVPHYISLNYVDLFKIQHVRNPFPLRPVSFSALASYLDCPACASLQLRKRKPKEPNHFTDLHQGTLFGGKKPDPRLIGTLLHAIITLLHDPKASLPEEQRQELLASPNRFRHFLHNDLLETLQAEGKLKLAMFFDQLHSHDTLFHTSILQPLMKYQQELLSTHSVVFATAERFQCKLLSTGNTFAGHSDWGGVVGLVGEFDQIRLRHLGSKQAPKGVPAIMEFKAGLGKKSSWDKLPFDDEDAELAEQPGVKHAFQLMIYWLAFQTRWSLREHVEQVRGRCDEIPMPLQQHLELILYNLFDGSQYQLVLTDQQRAFRLLITAIFCLDWTMKSGYVQQMADHECQKTSLFAIPPSRSIPVGSLPISSEECYMMARTAFSQLKELITWQKIEAVAMNGRNNAHPLR